MKTALLAGATGLIGGKLCQQMIDDAFYSSIHSFGRSKADFSSEKVQFHTLNFEELPNYSELESADDAFCCLGTTMKKAGSKDAFFKVDYEFVKIFAEYAFRSGATRFFLVSALGADKNSMIYYNQVKGEIEEAVQKIGFESVHIFRPSLLLGDRGKEKRIGEELGQKLASWFDFLIPKKYKAISGGRVAEFMLETAQSNKQSGICYYESEQMLK